MRKLLLTITALILFVLSPFCQKLILGINHCGLYYKSMEDLYKQKQKELEFYNFQPQQTIASIGAQCCNWEAAYAATTDSVRFYLEDIDSLSFNRAQADFAWNYYSTLRKKPMSSDFELVLGNEKKTNLPGQIFDKVLIINSFHEFNYQEEMLDDIAGKLKPNGILYIDETLARKTGELHHGCHKRIYLDSELIGILDQNGYQYIDGLVLNYRKSVPVRKIFAFRKKS